MLQTEPAITAWYGPVSPLGNGWLIMKVGLKGFDHIVALEFRQNLLCKVTGELFLQRVLTHPLANCCLCFITHSPSQVLTRMNCLAELASVTLRM